uniref:Membrane protein n=1 Tax=uncultured bacterium pAM1 TaxID=1781153 RepID=A0A1C9U4Y0_9BACT|nr:membrane protein [uncultured bacterium pAM1]
MPFSITISKYRTPFRKNHWLQGSVAVFSVVWLISLLGTTDISNWMLENILTMLFVIFLFYSYSKYQFSDLSYLLIFSYLCLHVYGSQYTYAENPFGYWLKDFFQFSRNHYDRIVHFSFGFLLATPLRETFLQWLKYPVWVAWILPIEVTLSVSAFYELIEWAVADIFFKEQGIAYLGTQGDIWDAQKDVFVAFLGAIIATTIVSLVKKFLMKRM